MEQTVVQLWDPKPVRHHDQPYRDWYTMTMTSVRFRVNRCVYPLMCGLNLMIMLVGCVDAGTAADRAQFAPPAGHRLLFIGQDTDTIDAYVAAVGHVPAGVMVYTSIQRLDGLFEQASYGSGPMNAPYLLKQYPQSCLQVGVYMVGALQDVVDGEYDANIQRLAQWLQQAHVPVFLRLGYEFDGPHNHYDPTRYQQAYRYMVDALEHAGVANVNYVWHSYAAGGPTATVEAWYPGDAYVDWVGVSYFEQPEDAQEPVLAFARAHDKPVMIAEATPRGIGTDMGQLAWQAWFHLLFRFADQHDIPIISYINANWEAQPMWRGQGWEDARVQADAYIKNAWLQEITHDTYLHASPELFGQLGYTAP